MHILVAPDKFKGTLTRPSGCEAVATGWSRVRPADHVESVPMADGGEGTMQALVDALEGRVASASVSGPLGDASMLTSRWCPRPMACSASWRWRRASGLGLLARGAAGPESDDDPWHRGADARRDRGAARIGSSYASVGARPMMAGSVWRRRWASGSSTRRGADRAGRCGAARARSHRRHPCRPELGGSHLSRRMRRGQPADRTARRQHRVRPAEGRVSRRRAGARSSVGSPRGGGRA